MPLPVGPVTRNIPWGRLDSCSTELSISGAIPRSFIVTGLGALFAIPVGLMSGIYAAEYAGTRFASAARFAADTLNGVPSIVVGVFVYSVAVLPFVMFSAQKIFLIFGTSDS